MKQTGTRVVIRERAGQALQLPCYNWVLISRNGNEMAIGCEGDGYASISATKRALYSVRRALARRNLPIVMAP